MAIAASSGVRNLSLLLAVTLFLACGKVVVDHQPIEQPAGPPSAAPAGRAAPATVNTTGGIGGSSPITPPARDAGAPPRTTDASTAPPPVNAVDGGSEDDAGTVRESLCDGSAALRLAFVSTGGFVAPTFSFTNPRGHVFLLVDGKCRYFVADDYMRGIFSGTLTPAEAEQLSTELHWNELGGWADYGFNKDAGCPDAGVVGLVKAKASAGCSCGCDPAAPSGLGPALQSANQWQQKLKMTGKPLEGAVTALILDSSIAKSPRQPELAWPLSRAIDSIPNLHLAESDPRFRMGDGPWARFEDAADYTKLREMRSATATASGPYGSYAVRLRDHDKEYDLYVRDELPAETERSWKELQATVPSW